VGVLRRRSLLAQNTDLIAEIPHEAVLAGIETGIQGNSDRTKYVALEVLSTFSRQFQTTFGRQFVPSKVTIQTSFRKMTAATTVVAATKPELVEDLATTLLETLRAEDPRRRTAALESLKTLSEHQPRILIDALPTIETILKRWPDIGPADCARCCSLACEGRTRTR